MELIARQARHSLSHTSLPALPAPREAIFDLQVTPSFELAAF